MSAFDEGCVGRSVCGLIRQVVVPCFKFSHAAALQNDTIKLDGNGLGYAHFRGQRKLASIVNFTDICAIVVRLC